MGELAVQFNSSGVVSAGGIFRCIEHTDEPSLSFHFDFSLISSGLLLIHTFRECSASITSSIGLVLRGGCQAKIRPPVIESVAIDMVHLGIGETKEYSMQVFISSIGEMCSGVVPSISNVRRIPCISRNEANIGSVDNGGKPFRQRDMRNFIVNHNRGSLLCRLAAGGRTIANRLGAYVTGLSLKIISAMFTNERNTRAKHPVSRDELHWLAANLAAIISGFSSDRSRLSTSADAVAWGIIGAHMNFLSCATPRDAPTSPGLSVPSIIPNISGPMGIPRREEG